MGKPKMSKISAVFFEHMKIGMLFYVKPIDLSINEIDRFAHFMNLSSSNTMTMLKDLIAHGIISAKICDDFQLRYKITEFGIYFFQELCSANEDASVICEKVGVIINEKDGT